MIQPRKENTKMSVINRSVVAKFDRIRLLQPCKNLEILYIFVLRPEIATLFVRKFEQNIPNMQDSDLYIIRYFAIKLVVFGQDKELV